MRRPTSIPGLTLHLVRLWLRRVRPVLVLGAVAWLAGALGVVWLLCRDEPVTQTVTVGDVVDDPDAYRDREVAVQGDLCGPTRRRDDGWHVSLTEGRAVLDVRARVLPDTLLGNVASEAMAIGTLADDVLQAHTIAARCPSKYDASYDPGPRRPCPR